MSDENRPADAPIPDAISATPESAAEAALKEPTVTETAAQPVEASAEACVNAMNAKESARTELEDASSIDEASAAEEPFAPTVPDVSAHLHNVGTTDAGHDAADLLDEAAAAEDEVPEESRDETDAVEPATPPAPESKKKWYVVKITSGREETIKAAIERKVKIEGLEEFYGQIAIPVEEFVEKKKVRVTDKKTGEKVTQEKNVTKHRKKYHGYLFAEVEFNDRILYLFRDTSGVGDFVGAAGPMKPPPPMSDREVQQMLTGVIDPKDRGKQKTVKVKLDISKGDKVKIRDGAFAGSEGEVKSITEAKDPTDTPKVTIVVTIWGRPVELEMDYWHVDKA